MTDSQQSAVSQQAWKLRKPKTFRVNRGLAKDFESACAVLGISEREAAEQALRNWLRVNHDEAQKRLDLYAERGITIIEPETVNIAVFQKADALLAKAELGTYIRALDGEMAKEDPHMAQVDLAKALKRVQAVTVRTRDPELMKLVQEAEAKLE